MKFDLRRLILTAAIAPLVATRWASGAPTTAPAEPTDGKHTPFVTVLYRDWAKWDVNGDGTITVDEVNRAVADPAVTGDDAAAAAAMKMVVRGRAGHELPPLTHAYFDGYNAKAMPIIARLTPDAAPKAADGSIAPTPTAGPTTGPAGARGRGLLNWDIDFRVSRKALASNGKGAAWQPDVVAANLSNLHQSATLGDCWLVAAVGSMSVHRPLALKQLVTVGPDGSTTVALHGVAPLHIPALTDSQRALGATSIGDGAWVAVLEQAIGRAKSVLSGGPANIDGNDEIIGGDSQQSIGFLTGHKIFRVTLSPTTAGRQARRDDLLPVIRRELVAAMAEHRVITAGVNPPRVEQGSKEAQALAHVPPNISKNHVYAIVDYDAKTDVVTIWNPHGQMYQPKGPDGLQFGYTTDHGRFHLPLTEAYAFYTSFTFERDEPTTQPAGLTRAD